jgi:phospholipid transport system substrate-binding protein
MKKRLLILSLIFVFLMVSPLSVYAAKATDAVQGGVDKILTKLRDPAFKELPREEQIAGIRSIINDIFDWTELSKRTLGRNWKKFSDAQQKEFVHLFSRLLEDVYADRLLAYSDEKVVFEKEDRAGVNRVQKVPKKKNA